MKLTCTPVKERLHQEQMERKAKKAKKSDKVKLTKISGPTARKKISKSLKKGMFNSRTTNIVKKIP